MQLLLVPSILHKLHQQKALQNFSSSFFKKVGEKSGFPTVQLDFLLRQRCPINWNDVIIERMLHMINFIIFVKFLSIRLILF